MSQSSELARILYYGDNLPVLRSHLPAECVDLVYLDPPFYSQRVYRAFFRQTPPGQRGQSNTRVFVDIWRWDAAVEAAYAALLANAPEPLRRTMRGLHEMLGPGSFLAYLVMMGERLLELHRVLKTTGSVYLHCDASASHYLKILLDAVFGPENFRNEIVWGYKTGGASQKHFARKHDLIFFYSKSDRYQFHALKEKSYMMHRYGFKKSTFLRDARGEYTWVYMKDVWELPALGAADGQRLGYPTQKPEALLERIIQASSNEGDLILDPFCGSGTTLAVAQRLGRNWLGIESHALGVAYQRYRLSSAFPDLLYAMQGGPATHEEAGKLARSDPAQFRWWALALVGARPVGDGKRERSERADLSVHGQLPAQAGKRAHFLVCVVKAVRETGVQRLLASLRTNPAPGVLIITLDEPEQASLARLTANTVARVVEVCCIADLLQNNGFT
jgi:site-specific DNA-methyltransferase (adenine-specific)